MQITVLTFNLEYNKGFPKLLRVIEKYSPDIIALQELQMSDDAVAILKEKGYVLASHAEAFIRKVGVFSVATFYKKGRIEVNESSTIYLPRGVWEFFELLWRGLSRRLVISTQFKVSGKVLSLFNVHLSPYSVNSLRNKQLFKTLEEAYIADNPTIILGDFNYPYNRSHLESLFNRYEFQEATTNILHTFYKTLRFLPIKFKLDYIFYRKLENIETKRINAFTTDHTPLIATFKIG
ncbi:endonuclease/exonuclease/phosphatase family protein [Candidatus Woesebacteria bacterium]|jgi:endonuclease/exonuclease/phosphatase (EEP) superfamily protein YafD|nr:endonuclease/exonuclease/phosphatase family protein [Candidatus Woesebacteria bacterium]